MVLIDNPVRNPIYVLVGRSPCVYSNSARRSSEEGARGGWLPADDDDDGGVANSSPSAGASKYDSSSIGSTLVSGNNWNKEMTFRLNLLLLIRVVLSNDSCTCKYIQHVPNNI